MVILIRSEKLFARCYVYLRRIVGPDGPEGPREPEGSGEPEGPWEPEGPEGHERPQGPGEFKHDEK